VTNYNPATTWLLKDRINCRLADASATCIAEILEDALIDQVGRSKITVDATHQISVNFSQWDKEIDKIYNYMCNPKDNLLRY
jgi:O-antigen biosynthesis protein